MAKKWDYSLSASKLSVLGGKDGCKRCFYNNCHKVAERPRGPFPSLPGGIDRVLKAHVDKYRGSMPPELANTIPGVLMGDTAWINKQRNWRSAMSAAIETPNGTVALIGAFDDLVQENDLVSPFDFKTKGSEPKTDGSEYYQVQSDVYGLQLLENGMKPSGISYFAYYWPAEVNDTRITFGVKVHMLKSDPEAARELISEATGILNDPKPDFNPDCQYCEFAQRNKD